MKRTDTIGILKEEIRIPEVVEQKTENVLARIRMEAKNAPQNSTDLNRTGEEQRMERGSWANRSRMDTGRSGRARRLYTRRAWSAAAAAVVVTGILGAGAAAAYMKWNKSLEEGLQMTTEQIQLLEDSQMTSSSGQSVTSEGVTVTAEQSIVDSHFAYLTFRVEGYEIEEAGVQPGFAVWNITDEQGESPLGDSSGSIFAEFYNGLIPGEDGRAVRADGREFETEEDGTWIMEDYRTEDGSLEYIIQLYSAEAGAFIGKTFHIEFAGLGLYGGKAEDVIVDVDGEWSFDWTLQGSDQMRICELDAGLGDSGATVVKAELSPISAVITYEFAYQEETETGLDENGAETTAYLFKEPPYFTGFMMKDGTMYTGISGMGSAGFTADSVYQDISLLDRTIDPDEVESLLFIKSWPEGEGAVQLTEENLYIVPVE